MRENMRGKEFQYSFVKLLVKGNPVKSLGIDAKLRRILRQCRRTRSQKGKMRSAGNKVELRLLGRMRLGITPCVIKPAATYAEATARFHSPAVSASA